MMLLLNLFVTYKLAYRVIVRSVLTQLVFIANLNYSQMEIMNT